MYPVPVTYLYDFEEVSEKMRPRIMHEFAANGAKHLVYTAGLIRQCLQNMTNLERMQKEMAAEGLTFVDAHVPYENELNLNAPVSPARRRIMAKYQKLVMEMTAYMGVKTLTVHSGNNSWFTPEQCSLQQNMDNVCAMLDLVLPTAEELGITYCMENIWFQTNTPDFLIAIKEKFPTDALGFCYDAGHANEMDKGRLYEDSNAGRAFEKVGVPVPWDDHILEKLLPNVVNCHIHDNTGQWDDHKIPGRGNVNWDHIVSLLKQAPRLQCIQSEVHPVHANESIREICEAFRKLFPETDA